jgi:hypothetical protein
MAIPIRFKLFALCLIAAVKMFWDICQSIPAKSIKILLAYSEQSMTLIPSQ